MRSFELVPVASNLPCKVESLDSWGNRIYVGTHDGQICSYVFEQLQSSDGKVSFKSRMESKKSVGKKSVVKLEVLEEINRLFALSDTNITVLNLLNLETSTPLGAAGKGVSSFATKKHSEDYRLCVQSKKKLSLYECVGAYVMYKELPIPDNVQEMDWRAGTIALAVRREYALIDIESGKLTSLPPYDKGNPLMVMIGDGEVVIGLNDMCAIVDSQGSATRGNIFWTKPAVAIGYYQPFLLSIQPQGIEIHNILNQRLVQSINFPSSVPLTVMSDGRGSKIFVASSSSPANIYALVPTPVPVLVAEMLRNGDVDDALELFNFTWDREARNTLETDADKKRKLAQIHETAGMHELRSLQFENAFSHFDKSGIDPRVLIGMFPGLLAEQSSFGVASRESIIDIIKHGPNVSVVLADEYANAASACLVKFLEKRCNLAAKDDVHKDINTALIKLYVSMPSSAVPALDALLQTRNFHAQDLENWLTNKKHYHALGLLYKNIQLDRKALKLWEKLGKGEYRDGNHDGVSESIELLTGTSVKELIWQFAPWLLARAPESAIRIFISNRRSTPLPPDEVLDFLAPLQNLLCEQYLEFLVNVENNQDERYSTRLALLYIDAIFMSEPYLENPKTAYSWKETSQSISRDKLIRLLENSQSYNPQAILARISSSALYEELIHVYKTIGDFEQVFRILVWELQDIPRADKMCTDFVDKSNNNKASSNNTNTPTTTSPHHTHTSSTQSSTTPLLESYRSNNSSTSSSGNNNSNNVVHMYSPKRQLMFLTLLKTYLNPPQSEPKQQPTQNSIPPLAMDFLNKYPQEMDPLKVLSLLPPTIPIQTILGYLAEAVRTNIQRLREGQIMKNLRKSENLRTKCQIIMASDMSAHISTDRVCPVCRKRLGDKVFALYPNGIVVHFKCFKDPHMCPVTGHNFKRQPKPIPDV